MLRGVERPGVADVAGTPPVTRLAAGQLFSSLFSQKAENGAVVWRGLGPVHQVASVTQRKRMSGQVGIVACGNARAVHRHADNYGEEYPTAPPTVSSRTAAAPHTLPRRWPTTASRRLAW